MVWERFPIGSESEDICTLRLTFRSTPHPRHSLRASICQDLNHSGLEQSIPKWPLCQTSPRGSDHYFLIKRLMLPKSSSSPLSNGFLTARHVECTFAVTRPQLSNVPLPPSWKYTFHSAPSFHKHLILSFDSICVLCVEDGFKAIYHPATYPSKQLHVATPSNVKGNLSPVDRLTNSHRSKQYKA